MAKYTYDLKHKIDRERERERQRERTKPEQHLSKEVISLEVTIFKKASMLDVWKGSDHVVA